MFMFFSDNSNSTAKRGRRKKFSIILVFVIYACLSYTAGAGTYMFREHQRRNNSDPLDVFWETWDKVETYFYGDIPSPHERTYGAIRGTLALLDDPYTTFVEPQSRDLERDRMRGTFGGIGVVVQRDADGQLMLSPYDHSPAERAGVREGDILLAVDHKTVTTSTAISEVKLRLRGEVGTTVTLTLSRPPTPSFEIIIERAQIQVPSVVWRLIDQAPTVGYLQITAFTERTGDEVKTALLDLLRNSGTDAIIIDLRDNPGGLIDPAVLTASQFLRDGLVMLEVSSRATDEREVPVQVGGIAIDIPVAVLVNGGTASAAEIVAGALQDHGRAPLIGERTFGKGSVQLIYDLSDGSSLHITSAVWFTPNHHPLDGQGLTPDIQVPRGDGSQDVQLERAITYLVSGH